jgi:hypothetical protein
MASRWTSLRSGNGKLLALLKASWEKVLSPLIARKTASRSFSLPATCPRPVSSGVQMLPQS